MADRQFYAHVPYHIACHVFVHVLLNAISQHSFKKILNKITSIFYRMIPETKKQHKLNHINSPQHNVPAGSIGTNKRVLRIKQHSAFQTFCSKTLTTVVLATVTQTRQDQTARQALRHVYVTVYQAFRFSQPE